MNAQKKIAYMHDMKKFSAPATGRAKKWAIAHERTASTNYLAIVAPLKKAHARAELQQGEERNRLRQMLGLNKITGYIDRGGKLIDKAAMVAAIKKCADIYSVFGAASKPAIPPEEVINAISEAWRVIRINLPTKMEGKWAKEINSAMEKIENLK